MLVQRANESPYRHRRPRNQAPPGSAPLPRHESPPQQGVFGPLDERNGHPFPGLTVVGHGEPLVAEVSTAVNHELGTEDPTKGPAGHHGGNDGVSQGQSGYAGPVLGQDEQTEEEGECDTPETRETSLPHREPTPVVALVVRPVGGDVGGPRTDQARDEETRRESRKGSGTDALLSQTSLRVLVGDEGRDGEAQTVEMKIERTEVKAEGEGRHV